MGQVAKTGRYTMFQTYEKEGNLARLSLLILGLYQSSLSHTIAGSLKGAR